jgi:Tfp pilus assembly protein PilZ
MVPNPEKRNHARTNHRCPVTIEDLKAGRIYNARMLNYSEKGLYFEADKLLRQGERIHIGIENTPLTSLSDTYAYYRAKIIWRKKLKTSSFYYGYGVKYAVNYNKLNLQMGGIQEVKDIRRHERKPYSKSIYFATENRIFGGLTQNISPAGVFIKANDNLAAGQIVILGIPSKKMKKTKVKGKVVWSNLDGFGVRFLGSKKK